MSDRIEELIRWALTASDDEVGPACMNVPVPPTIAEDEAFREPYSQGYRHALRDVRAFDLAKALEASLQARAEAEQRANDLAECLEVSEASYQAMSTALRTHLKVLRDRADLNMAEGLAIGLETDRCADELEALLSSPVQEQP